jgi:hypothetical protein
MNPPREQWLARLDVCWGRLISTKDNGPLRLALRAREGVVDAAVIVVPVAVVIVVPVAVAPLPVLSLSVVVQWRHCLVIRHPSSVNCRPSFVGSQHLQSTPRAVAREAGGRCAALSICCNKYRT